MSEITDFVQDEAGQTADIIWGSGYDENLGDGICVTVIATGFNSNGNVYANVENKTNKVVLEIETPTLNTLNEAPVNSVIDEIKFEEKTIETPLLNTTPVNNVVEDKTEYIQFTLDDTPQLNTQPKPDLDLFKGEDEVTPLFAPVNNITQQNDFFEPKTDTVPLASFDSKPVVEPEKTRDDLFRQNERMLRLKEISHRLKSPSGLKDLESEPAFKRRNLKLEENQDGNMLSNTSMTFDEDGVKIVKENRFLHGNVD